MSTPQQHNNNELKHRRNGSSFSIRSWRHRPAQVPLSISAPIIPGMDGPSGGNPNISRPQPPGPTAFDPLRGSTFLEPRERAPEPPSRVVPPPARRFNFSRPDRNHTGVLRVSPESGAPAAERRFSDASLASEDFYQKKATPHVSYAWRGSQYSRAPPLRTVRHLIKWRRRSTHWGRFTF